MENSTATNQSTKPNNQLTNRSIKLITTTQAQKMLGYKSRGAIYRLIDICLIPKTYRATDNTFLFDEEDIKKLIAYRAATISGCTADIVTKLSDVKKRPNHSCCGQHKESNIRESNIKESNKKEANKKESSIKEAVVKKTQQTNILVVEVPLEYFRKSKETDSIFQKNYLGLATMTVWTPQELLIRFKEKVKKKNLTFRSVFKEFFENYVQNA